MTGIDAIGVVGAEAAALLTPASTPCTELTNAPQVGFGDLLARGVAEVEDRVNTANELVRAFALDDSVPVHQVTIALEEARIAVELALQVRTRLIEGYREIMNMQL